MKSIKNRKAFTIVEMVIVIAVIAILATVLVPTISGVIQMANKSADQQFAASLNVQLALWEVDNGEIADEHDLRDAINYYYGKWNDDKTVLEEDFYSTLIPKSGKQGYHYWYSVADKQVVLAKYEELAKEANGEIVPVSLEVPGTFAAAAINADGLANQTRSLSAPLRIVAAPAALAAENEQTFSPYSPRSLVISTEDGEKNYFLLDQGGSKLADNLKALDTVTDNTDYAIKVQTLSATEAETSLAAKLTAKLQSIAIGNENGVFYPEDWAKASHVYIPYGTQTLGASKVSTEKLEVKEIHLPETMTQLGTGSLLGLTRNEDDIHSSTIIYADIPADKMHEFVAADSFNCVLQSSTGERFAFMSGELTNLETQEKIQTEYSVALKSFGITASTDANKKYDLHSWNDGTFTLHYTADLEGTITLKADNFVDEKDQIATRTATWTVGETPVKGNTLPLTKEQLAANAQISVTAQNVTYSIAIEKVAIDTFTATVGGQLGEPYDKNGDGFADYKLNLEYKKGSSWAVASTVTLKPVLTCVEMSSDVTLALSGEGASNLTIDGSTLKVKDTATGSFAATLIVTTKGTDANGSQISVEYDLTFKLASSTFAIADNANTQTTYNIKFTVGTVQPIKLGTLFKLVDGAPSDIQVTWSNNGGAATPFTYTSQSGDWTNWEITPSAAGENFAIAISDGGATCTLNVKVVSGAYNVATPEQWNSVPNSKSIAVLKDITIPSVSVSEFKTGAGSYSKNLGSSTIYGNLNKVEMGTFLIKVKSSNNYFLYASSAKINDLIIVGPEYDKASNSRTDSTSSSGYYVAGIEAAGSTTISNSYIAGFRTPLRVDGNTITLKDSTLVGGAFANIYVAKVSSATTIKLINSNTVQASGLHGSVGAGIYIDQQDNIKSGSVTQKIQVIFEGNTMQYNWVYEDGTYSGNAGSVVKALFNSSGCDDNKTYTYERFFHNIGGTDYANTGIAFEKSMDYVDVTNTSTNGLQLCTTGEAANYSSWYVRSYLSCGDGCSHNLYPGGGDTYNAEIFRSAKKIVK